MIKDDLLKRIEGPVDNHNPLFTKKQGSISRHIQSTRQEFIGKPEVCAKVMEHIVHIRRKNNLDYHLNEFQSTVSTYIDVLCEHLTTRWLISILDTIALHGENDCKSAALAVSALMNMLIISDTVLAACDIDEIPKKVFDPDDDFFKLEYGCMMFNTESGDNFSNLIRMINHNSNGCPNVKKIWKTVLKRIQNTNNMMTKLKKIHVAPKGGHRFY